MDNPQDAASHPAHAMPRDEHPGRTGRSDGAREIDGVKPNVRSTVDSLMIAMGVVGLTRVQSATAVALSVTAVAMHKILRGVDSEGEL